LPFPEIFFDKVFSIRALHHIPSKEFRLQFFSEIKRVLKPGGILILTAWYLYGLTEKRNFLLMLKSAFLKIIGKSKLDFGDALIPWGKKVRRYYHYFTKRELERLAEESGFKVKKIWATSFDIYLVAQKPL
jgi:SAM-dependent methyltransferase